MIYNIYLTSFTVSIFGLFSCKEMSNVSDVSNNAGNSGNAENVKIVQNLDSRPSFEEIYMNLAELMSKRSTCSRLHVGTVITTTDFRKVLAVGYNGNAAGLDNVCDSKEPGNCGDIHGEANAIINCDSPRYLEKYVFVTHSPCIMCAKMLINLGNVKKVYYRSEYRITTSLEILKKVGIDVIKMD